MKNNPIFPALFFGTFLGLALPFLLFFAQTLFKQEMVSTRIVKNMIQELEYNQVILEKFNNRYDQILRSILNENKKTFLGIAYTDIRFHFLREFSEKGNPFDIINADEFQGLLTMTSNYNPGWENIIRERLHQWNHSNLPANDILEFIEKEKGNLIKNKKLINQIVPKLQAVIN